MAAELARVERPLRSITSRWMDSIEQAVHALRAEFHLDRQAAAKRDEAVAAGLSTLERTVGALNNTVAELAGKINKAEPFVEDYRLNQAQARGASELRDRLWKASAVIATIVATLLGSLLLVLHH